MTRPSLHTARVLLSECAKRRHQPQNREFYWTLFAWAQDCRRRAEAARPAQRDLFASEAA